MPPGLLPSGPKKGQPRPGVNSSALKPPREALAHMGMSPQKSRGHAAHDALHQIGSVAKKPIEYIGHLAHAVDRIEHAHNVEMRRELRNPRKGYHGPRPGHPFGG